MLQYADNSLSFIQFFFFFAFKFIELISGFKQANFYSAVIKQIQRQSLMFYIASKPTKKKIGKQKHSFIFWLTITTKSKERTRIFHFFFLLY